MNIIKATILTIDEPLWNGVVYPREAAEALIENFYSKKEGTVLSYSAQGGTGNGNYKDLNGVVRDLYITGNELIAEIEAITSLPNGELLYEARDIVQFTPIVLAYLNDDYMSVKADGIQFNGVITQGIPK